MSLGENALEKDLMLVQDIYIYTNVPCDGSCLWVFDYLNIKKLETKKNKLLHKKN